MNFLDKPFSNPDEPVIPAYPFYGYDNSEELDKDVDYMKNLYSKTMKMIQKEVEEECDKLEYGGSCMFDAFPDQVHLGTIIDRIYDRLKDTDWNNTSSLSGYSLQAEQLGRPSYRQPPCRGNNCPPPPPRPSRSPQPPRPNYRPDGNPDWLRDLISTLLYNEMIHRRRRYRSRRRMNNR